LSCDHVIANTEGNRTRLLGAFPRLDPRRVSVVTNAFDTDTMPDMARAEDPALACDIAYFGEIYGGMLDRYLETVRVLVARDPQHAPRLHVFGRYSDDDARRVRQAGLENHIVFMGSVSYEKSLALMRAARSLLLLLPDGDSMATCVPSKLYPYLFAGRPVLAMVPPGDAARVVQESGVGDVVAPGDLATNADRVAAFIERVRRGETVAESVRLRAVSEYSMERIAQRVHEILREVQRG
jgi:glycosyltransferase involved in cell wall biosynthesis